MEDGLGTVQTILVLGGSSDIARETLRRLVGTRTRHVVLAARHPKSLAPLAAELRGRGAGVVDCVKFDATNVDRHEALIADAAARLGDVDLVLATFGVLGDQAEAEASPAAAAEIARVNYLGAVSVLTAVGAQLRAQGHGVVVALSSVAGERARRSNYVYGSSKAGLDAFLQGLGDQLAGSGPRVLIVRPGFVHTKMTAGLDPAPFSVTPDAVADAIVDVLASGREIVWVPPVLRPAMTVIRHLPRAVFRRLSL